MNGIKPSFNCYIPPLEYKAGDLKVPDTGVSNFRHVYQMPPSEIRAQFKFSKMQKLGKAIKSFGTGFKTGAKKGLLAGAAIGATAGAVVGIIGAMSFPPSALAIGVSIGLGALKFGLGGALLLGVSNGIRKFVSTAFHQFRSSPEKLMSEEAAKGRKLVDKLVNKAMSGKQLTEKENKDLEYYQLWTPAWQKSSNYYSDYSQSLHDENTPLCDLPGDEIKSAPEGAKKSETPKVVIEPAASAGESRDSSLFHSTTSS